MRSRIKVCASLATPHLPNQHVTGEHEFSWAVMPHRGHFLESDVPVAAYLFNSPIHGELSDGMYYGMLVGTQARLLRYLLVRFIPGGGAPSLAAPRSPFVLSGAKNVFLETVKRGDLDSDMDGKRTVILRMYEAYGGYAQVNLHVAGSLCAQAAYSTNLLEDDGGAQDLALIHAADASASAVVHLTFRGFEVKTIKLVLGGMQG
jgi:alpha-mannosidase